MNGELLEKQIGRYGPDLFADFVCAFIRRHRDEPFFCYYPMVLVHDPFVPTPDTPEWHTSDRHQRDNRFFGAMVAYTDTIVGKILDVLAEEGLAEEILRGGSAVTRNRLRRRLRSILGSLDVPPGLVLVGASPRVIELTFDQLRERTTALIDAMRRSAEP